MEIERKYLIHKLPDHLEAYPHRTLEQAYLCTEPVVRVRRDADDYILTYKSKGLMMKNIIFLLPRKPTAICSKRQTGALSQKNATASLTEIISRSSLTSSPVISPLFSLPKSNFLPKKRQIPLPHRTGLVRMSPFPANIITVH